ncbi:MAG: hypothetical protein WBV31_05700 [Terriglobales bacterium]|jgi:biopolymer transport protein ExbB/TolQ
MQDKIPQMARGWESKSVEQQQSEMTHFTDRTNNPRLPLSLQEQQHNRKRDGLLLSRQRLAQQLKAAANPRHRQMLEQAITELDRQLSSLKVVADPTSLK